MLQEYIANYKKTYVQKAREKVLARLGAKAEAERLRDSEGAARKPYDHFGPTQIDELKKSSPHVFEALCHDEDFCNRLNVLEADIDEAKEALRAADADAELQAVLSVPSHILNEERNNNIEAIRRSQQPPGRAF